MTDARLSGYKAAAQTVSFTGTQTLASLGDDEWTNLSDAIDNSTNKYMFADFEVVLDGTPSFTGTDSAVELYLLPSVDGSTYPNWTGNVTSEEQENNQYFIGAVTTTGATGAQRMTLRGIELPPGLFKIGVRNRTGAALNATGNTVKWRPWQYESV